ncbi:hypothetical protein [Nonomuraea sp. NPDC048916]|uniref:hypothetical protein n=1 Tax=Nonomuraea sp. NPDC048916 TaxID=3154232 RepID=UPI0033F6FC8C
MRKALALAVGAVAIVGLLAMPGRTAGNAQWQLGTRASSLEFNAHVVPIAQDDVWAFGTRRFWEWSLGPTAVHWDGERWRDEDVPGGFGTSVMAADASSATNVWLVTNNETGQVVSRRDGTRWITMRATAPSGVADIEVLGERDVWLFGEETWHYTGSGWARADLPMYVHRAGVRSPDDIWAIGSDSGLGRPAVAHYDGTRWSIIPIEGKGSHFSLNGVSADTAGVWITGTVSDDTTRTSKPVLLRRTGDRWQDEPVEKVAGPWRETFDPVPDGRGGHWFLGSTDVNSYDSALAHRSAEGVWTQTPVSQTPGAAEFSTLTGVPGTGRLLATGSFDGVSGIFIHHSP